MSLLPVWQRLTGVRPEERRALGWAFLYFFCLLAAYYTLRPLRDEMGITGGIESLPWVFTATFLVMLAVVPLFGWVSARYPRRSFLPAVYVFFIGNLLLFWALFLSSSKPAPAARAFFVWVSVFNLFVVSVFWSFMADIFSTEQAKRLFGIIAAGGSAGAIAGPTLAALLARELGPTHLLLVAAGLLSVPLLCIRRLDHWSQRTQAAPVPDQALGGGIWAGLGRLASDRYLLGIAAFVLLFTTLSTFLYFAQAYILRDAFDDSASRTAVFAGMDLTVNVLTVLTQLLATGRLVERFGIAAILAVVPLWVAAGFAALAVAPILPVLLVFQVLRRAGNYALTRPARETLFTAVDRESRYKAKNVIDTLVYRGGDAVSGWAYAGLAGLGLALTGIATVAVPLALLWALAGLWLGRRFHRRTITTRETDHAVHG